MTLNSLALFVGTGRCNANCSHCAGVPLRKYAPKYDGLIDYELTLKTIRDCYSQGARYLSLSSSGEPTLSPLSVTKILELISGCSQEGINFSPINMYSNGIIIGENKKFCDRYFPLWKSLGLTTIYVTVHSVDEEENARVYGINRYPRIKDVFENIHDAGLYSRANIILNRNTIGTIEVFVETVEYLRCIGVNNISAWQIRDEQDEVDKELSPSVEELEKIEDWIDECKDPNVRMKIFREKSRIAYQIGEKLTLFPDGSLSNSWCNH